MGGNSSICEKEKDTLQQKYNSCKEDNIQLQKNYNLYEAKDRIHTSSIDSFKSEMKKIKDY